MPWNGKAPVLYHKHRRPVNHTTHPGHKHESAELLRRLNAVGRDMMHEVSLRRYIYITAIRPLD
jgi:hypothetical protein